MSSILVVPSLIVAGRTFVDPDNIANLKQLQSRYHIPLRFSSMVDKTGTVYQVPGDKVLRVVAIRVVSSATGSTAARADLLYGDTDVGLSSVSAPTNPVYFSTFSSSNQGVIISGAGEGLDKELSVEWEVPASKYPHANSQVGGPQSLYIWGFEE